MSCGVNSAKQCTGACEILGLLILLKIAINLFGLVLGDSTRNDIVPKFYETKQKITTTLIN